MNSEEKIEGKDYVIWEDEYHNNPKETIVKCVNFIYA